MGHSLLCHVVYTWTRQSGTNKAEYFLVSNESSRDSIFTYMSFKAGFPLAIFFARIENFPLSLPPRLPQQIQRQRRKKVAWREKIAGEKPAL